MTILKTKLKTIYCLICKEFQIVEVSINECPKCHYRFKCSPVDIFTKKVKVTIENKTNEVSF